MRKSVYILMIGIMTLGVVRLNAQQQHQLTQYVQNPYIINSAFAGMYDYIDINASFRQQWVGINNSPRTYYLSINGKLGGDPASYNPSLRISGPRNVKPQRATTGKVKHGYGAMILRDEAGAFYRTAAMGSYAIHLPVTREYNIAFSSMVGWSMHSIDDSKVNLLDTGDPKYMNFLNTGNNQHYLDLNASAMFYSEKFFIGYTGSQLLKSRIPFTNGENFKLVMHHYAIAGVNLEFNRDLKMTPMFVMKYMHPAPPSFDLGFKMVYQDWFWGGLMYRHFDAVSLMFGLYANNIFKIGYSYDLTISKLSTVSSGSHEIVLGVTLGR